MRRLFLALLLAAGSCAPAPVPPPQAHPALWVVRDPDTTIYLFGTVHVLKPGLHWFEGGVKRAFDASGELVMELVMPPEAEMQALVAELGTDPAGPPLPSTLSPAQAERMHGALAEAGLPADTLDHAEPWLAATMLSVLPLRRLGYEEKDGAEAVLTAAARSAGKRLTGLETAREQLGYFDRLPPPAQHQLLAETIDALPQADATFTRMIDAWRGGDADGIAALLNEDLKQSPELAQALLVNRNRHWAAWIAERMKRPGTVFLAVGAGHLAGPAAVQAELAGRGLKAERVQY